MTRKHPFHVWEKEVTLSKLTKPFVAAVKHHLYIHINGVSCFPLYLQRGKTYNKKVEELNYKYS